MIPAYSIFTTSCLQREWDSRYILTSCIHLNRSTVNSLSHDIPSAVKPSVEYRQSFCGVSLYCCIFIQGIAEVKCTQTNYNRDYAIKQYFYKYLTLAVCLSPKTAYLFFTFYIIWIVYPLLSPHHLIAARVVKYNTRYKIKIDICG